MPQQNTQPELIPGEPLIYERAAGIVYARYRDLPDIPRWIVGGNPEGFIPGTGMPRPDEWWEIKDPMPDWDLIQKNTALRELYTVFLKEQEKYKTWETLSGQRR